MKRRSLVTDKALMIANGFEGTLFKVRDILKNKYNISFFDFVYIIGPYQEAYRGISGLDEEIDSINNCGKKLKFSQKKPLSSFKHLLHEIKVSNYQFFIFSSEGDKQFLLWPLLFFIRAKNCKFIYFNLQQNVIECMSIGAMRKTIFKKIANRRTLNLFLNRISRYFKLSRVFGYPDNLLIEPTNICNLRCKICLTGLDELNREKGKIDKDKFFKIMDECGRYIRHLNLYFMGESLLHPDLSQMIAYAKGKGVEIVEISTNGNFNLSDEQIKTLLHSGINIFVFSVDGADQATYEKYRDKGNLNLVLKNIKKISSIRKRENLFYPKLLIQFILMKHNLGQIEKMKEIVRSTGADELRVKKINLKMANLDYGKINKFLPEEDHARLYDIKNFRLVPKSKRNSICTNPWDAAVIAWNGDILPCCGDFTGSLKLGNVFMDKSFKKIWNGKPYISFRRQIRKDMSKIPLCRNCPGN